MKTRQHNILSRFNPALWQFSVVGLALAMILALSGPTAADKSSNEPIRITADKLMTDNQKRSAQFSGKVKAVQGQTVITADRLTIFYNSQENQSVPDSAENIERMEASGNVRIEFDNKVAVSNQAVYIISERKLVLKGSGSKVISGQNEITGSKITFYRDSGQVAMEGDEKNRVNAIIHSDQRGLN